MSTGPVECCEIGCFVNKTCIPHALGFFVKPGKLCNNTCFTVFVDWSLRTHLSKEWLSGGLCNNTCITLVIVSIDAWVSLLSFRMCNSLDTKPMSLISWKLLICSLQHKIIISVYMQVFFFNFYKHSSIFFDKNNSYDLQRSLLSHCSCFNLTFLIAINFNIKLVKITAYNLSMVSIIQPDMFS